MFCEICKKKSEVLETHHIASKMCGGSNHLSNLCKICPECHRLIHKPSISWSKSKKGKRIVLEGRFDSTLGNILVWHYDGEESITGFRLPPVYLTDGTVAGDGDEYFNFYNLTTK